MAATGPARRAGRIAAAAAVACLALGLLAPLTGWLSVDEQRALGVALFAVLLWTAQPVPVELSSLAVLLLIPALGLLDFAATFAPFSGSTVWLIFAGMVLSRLLAETGLGRRLAGAVLPWIAGGSRLRLLAGLHGLGLAAALLVPSAVVRMLLLLPVAIEFCRSLDPDDEDRPLRTAVFLSIISGTYYGGCGVLTGSVPNLVVAGQLEAVTGRVIYWGEWLLWMFPVLGIVRTAVSVGLVWLLWGRHAGAPRRHRGAPEGPLDAGQRRALVLLVAGIALWSTDVVHGLAPVYVGLGLSLAAAAPRWGVLDVTDLRRLNFPIFFYIVALFGVGDILGATGFNGRMIATVTGWLPDGHGHWLAEPLRLMAATLPLDFLMDVAAVGAVATPGLLEVGAAAGLPPLAAAMSVALATTVAFLPYQSAPFMVALSFDVVRSRDLALLMLLLSTLSVTVLAPLNVWWWRTAGLF